MATEMVNRPRRETSAVAEGLVDVENAALADTDAFETHDDLFLRLDVPGVGKGSVQVEVDENNTLQIRAKNSFKEPKNVLLRELEIGDYYRSFRLGQEFDKDKISAKLEDGVLEITIPKKEEVKPRRIAIKA